MPDILADPWPWYVAGPVIGLLAPLLLLLGNKSFGVSSVLRHLCAAGASRCDYFAYDWRAKGTWNLLFVTGLAAGGAVAALVSADAPVAISEGTRSQLSALGITDFSGLAPADLFSWQAFRRWPAIVAVVIGGWLVGFGTAWAGGCTSGHSIAGLADLQVASLVATVAFMVGGLASTYLILPWVLGGLR